MDSVPAYDVNRALIASDLERIASALSPLIVSQLESHLEMAIETIATSDLRVGPFGGFPVGPLLARMFRDRGSRLLPASVTPQLLAALRRVLELSDEDLAALCEASATELGAWVGALDPVPPEQLAAAARPLARVVGADG